MFLVVVALGMAFLLFSAFLNVIKAKTGAPLFNESNMLYMALVFYAGAGALYMGYGVTRIERYVSSASIATMIGFLANTFAAGHRWYMAGRPPFSNMYEMLLSFVWTVALLTLVAERFYKVKIIGSVGIENRFERCKPRGRYRPRRQTAHRIRVVHGESISVFELVRISVVVASETRRVNKSWIACERHSFL